MLDELQPGDTVYKRYTNPRLWGVLSDLCHLDDPRVRPEYNSEGGIAAIEILSSLDDDPAKNTNIDN